MRLIWIALVRAESYHLTWRRLQTMWAACGSLPRGIARQSVYGLLSRNAASSTRTLPPRTPPLMAFRILT